MARYHINSKTGNVGACKAMVNCPFGDLETAHYSTAEEARAAYESSHNSFEQVDREVRARTLRTVFSNYSKNPQATLSESVDAMKEEKDDPELNPGLLYAAYAIPQMKEKVREKFYKLPSSYYSIFKSTHLTKGYSSAELGRLIERAHELHQADPTWRPEERSVMPRSSGLKSKRRGAAVDMQNVSSQTYSLLEDYVKLKFGEAKADAFWATVKSDTVNKPKLSDYSRALKEFTKEN